MFLDIAPGGRKKHATRSQVQKIKKGGAIADRIRELSNEDHQENEVPDAEQQMENAIENWPEVKEEKEKKEAQKKTWWQKVKDFFFL